MKKLTLLLTVLFLIFNIFGCEKKKIHRTGKPHTLIVFVHASPIGRGYETYENGGYALQKTGAQLLIDGCIPKGKWWSDNQSIQKLVVYDGAVIEFLDSQQGSSAYIWNEIYLDSTLIDMKHCQCYMNTRITIN